MILIYTLALYRKCSKQFTIQYKKLRFKLQHIIQIKLTQPPKRLQFSSHKAISIMVIRKIHSTKKQIKDRIVKEGYRSKSLKTTDKKWDETQINSILCRQVCFNLVPHKPLRRRVLQWQGAASENKDVALSFKMQPTIKHFII